MFFSIQRLFLISLLLFSGGCIVASDDGAESCCTRVARWFGIGSTNPVRPSGTSDCVASPAAIIVYGHEPRTDDFSPRAHSITPGSVEDFENNQVSSCEDVESDSDFLDSVNSFDQRVAAQKYLTTLSAEQREYLTSLTNLEETGWSLFLKKNSDAFAIDYDAMLRRAVIKEVKNGTNIDHQGVYNSYGIYGVYALLRMEDRADILRFSPRVAARREKWINRYSHQSVIDCKSILQVYDQQLKISFFTPLLQLPGRH